MKGLNTTLIIVFGMAILIAVVIFGAFGARNLGRMVEKSRMYDEIQGTPPPPNSLCQHQMIQLTKRKGYLVGSRPYKPYYEKRCGVCGKLLGYVVLPPDANFIQNDIDYLLPKTEEDFQFEYWREEMTRKGVIDE